MSVVCVGGGHDRNPVHLARSIRFFLENDVAGEMKSPGKIAAGKKYLTCAEDEIIRT